MYCGSPPSRVEFAQVDTNESLSSSATSARRCHDTAAELTGLVDERPLRERLRELLMLALYRSGRQADALLARDVGIEPGPGLRTLHQQILQSAPELSADIGC
jgi:DNA-binding SARP family transcriptional activator